MNTPQIYGQLCRAHVRIDHLLNTVIHDAPQKLGDAKTTEDLVTATRQLSAAAQELHRRACGGEPVRNG